MKKKGVKWETQFSIGIIFVGAGIALMAAVNALVGVLFMLVGGAWMVKAGFTKKKNEKKNKKR